MTNDELNSLLQKARVLGMLTELKTPCRHTCALIRKTNDDCLLYIPDNVTRLKNDSDMEAMRCGKGIDLSGLHGNIKVVGGNGLIITKTLFEQCRFKDLDLSEFDVTNIKSMEGMFCDCTADNLIFKTPVDNNINNLDYMFLGASIDYIDLSEFYTPKVKYMYGMFQECISKQLNIVNFHTNDGTLTFEMFKDSKIHEPKITDTTILDEYNEHDYDGEDE